MFGVCTFALSFHLESRYPEARAEHSVWLVNNSIRKSVIHTTIRGVATICMRGCVCVRGTLQPANPKSHNARLQLLG